MYVALFRALPGPRWLKILQAIVLVVFVILALFTWVFPWIAQNVSIFDNTVG